MLLKWPRTAGLSASMVLAFTIFCGCATAPTTHIERVWPEPPARPRIKYLRSIYGDEGIKRSLFERLASGGAPTKIKKPYGVFSDGDGRVYIADTAWGLVMVLDFTENESFFIGNRRDNGRLTMPVNVTADKEGNIYAVDAAQKRVVVFDRGGGFISAIGTPGEFDRPTGIALDEALGRIYVSDTPRHVVRAYDFEGDFLFEFRGAIERKIAFHYPTNIRVGDDGRVYVTDSMNFRVMVFDSEGRYLSKIGRIGTLPGMFARPRGVALDGEGHVYVVDAMLHNVQIFDDEGRLLLVFGEYGLGVGQFWLPAGICIDKNDTIYVSDSLNRRIQVFQYLP